MAVLSHVPYEHSIDLIGAGISIEIAVDDSNISDELLKNAVLFFSSFCVIDKIVGLFGTLSNTNLF